KSQQHVTRAPDVLAGIMDDPKQSAKHRIDSAKVLDSFSGNGPKAAPEQDRVIIRIDMGADVRAKGLETNPAAVLRFEASLRPNPDPNNTHAIDAKRSTNHAHPDNTNDEPPPARRGPGRPPGSKNKPKVNQQESLPGFRIENKHL